MENRIRLQLLINGKSDELVDPPLHFFNAIVARIRTLANMDGADEGRITLKVKRKKVVLDVKISPSTHGESVHMKFVEEAKAAKRERFWA